MNKIWLLAVLISLAACSSKQPATDAPPGKEAALNEINTRYVILQRALDFDIGRTGTDCYFPGNGQPFDIGYRPETDLETIVAVKAGLVEVKAAEKNRWDVTLTEKGKAVANAGYLKPIHHRVGNGCDEYQISFPLAMARAFDVAGPKPEADSYEYTYSWKWEITELGKTLRQDGEVFSKLTQSQRQQLQELTNVRNDVNAGPLLSIPVPLDTDNRPRPGTAIFKKERDRWVFNVRQ